MLQKLANPKIWGRTEFLGARGCGGGAEVLAPGVGVDGGDGGQVVVVRWSGVAVGAGAGGGAGGPHWYRFRFRFRFLLLMIRFLWYAKVTTSHYLQQT